MKTAKQKLTELMIGFVEKAHETMSNEELKHAEEETEKLITRIRARASITSLP